MGNCLKPSAQELSVQWDNANRRNQSLRDKVDTLATSGFHVLLDVGMYSFPDGNRLMFPTNYPPVLQQLGISPQEYANVIDTVNQAFLPLAGHLPSTKEEFIALNQASSSVTGKWSLEKSAFLQQGKESMLQFLQQINRVWLQKGLVWHYFHGWVRVGPTATVKHLERQMHLVLRQAIQFPPVMDNSSVQPMPCGVCRNENLDKQFEPPLCPNCLSAVAYEEQGSRVWYKSPGPVNPSI